MTDTPEIAQCDYYGDLYQYKQRVEPAIAKSGGQETGVVRVKALTRDGMLGMIRNFAQEIGSHIFSGEQVQKFISIETIRPTIQEP